MEVLQYVLERVKMTSCTNPPTLICQETVGTGSSTMTGVMQKDTLKRNTPKLHNSGKRFMIRR